MGRASLLVALALALFGCTTPRTPLPAMAAFGTSGDFGYSERDLGDGRREVTYVGAAIPVNAWNPKSDARFAMEQEKVRDLAFWRLADIALANNYPAFRIDGETRDNDVIVRDEVVPRPPLFPMHGYYGYYGYRYRHPWWFADDYGYDTRRRASVRAKITLEATLLRDLAEEDPAVFDAKKIQAQMKERRAGAVY